MLHVPPVSVFAGTRQHEERERPMPQRRSPVPPPVCPRWSTGEIDLGGMRREGRGGARIPTFPGKQAGCGCRCRCQTRQSFSSGKRWCGVGWAGLAWHGIGVRGLESTLTPFAPPLGVAPISEKHEASPFKPRGPRSIRNARRPSKPGPTGPIWLADARDQLYSIATKPDESFPGRIIWLGTNRAANRQFSSKGVPTSVTSGP